MNKKAQSEMIGFVLIIIIVAVLILVFISLSVRNNNDDSIKSFEVESFIQSSLDYTTTCAKNYEPNYLSLRKLVFACIENQECSDETSSCKALNQTLTSLIESSWQVGEEWPTKGYYFKIDTEMEELMSFQKGNKTNNYKSGLQIFEDNVTIHINIYS